MEAPVSLEIGKTTFRDKNVHNAGMQGGESDRGA